MTELHWYAGADRSGRVAGQLTGHLLLLVPAAVLAVLQWALPLGRVVSPMDALLNAGGAVLAGLLTAAVPGIRRAGSGGLQRVWAAP